MYGEHRRLITHLGLSQNSFYPELPESNGACCRNVERIYPMRHRNADSVIACRNGARGKAVSLRAEDDRNFFLR